ncbi:MAG: hypothetical protein V3V95_09080, partial [Thermodesulfobacteriota bacterium]
ALPDNMESASSKMTVDGRRGLKAFNSTMNFGPYNVTNIHKGWTRGEGFSILGFGSSKAKQKYEFSIGESGSPVWNVQCASGAKWKKLKGFLGEGITTEFGVNKQLICIMEQVGTNELARLVMKQTRKELVMEGVMTAGGNKIDISVIYKVEGSPFKLSDPTGYTFHIDGRPVGAVEVMNAGTVWLNNSVGPETRTALASASAVLLMYQDIKKISGKK